MKIALPITGILLVFLMVALTRSISYGDVILYKVPSMEVVEAFREPVPLQPGYAQVTVANADLVVWPAPSGCAKGDQKWSIVASSAIPPTFTLNPALKFFHCQIVSSAAEVDRVAEEEVVKLAGPRLQQQMKQMRQAIKLLDVLAVECPPGSTTTGCDTKRTKALTARTEMLNLDSQIEQIYSDATAFKTAQGW